MRDNRMFGNMDTFAEFTFDSIRHARVQCKALAETLGLNAGKQHSCWKDGRFQWKGSL